MSEYVTSAYGEALFKLMKKKNIEKITVDELCEEDGIGRATYFRNFKSKDEIITAYIIMKWREYEREHRLKEHQINDSYRVRRYFDFCYKETRARNYEQRMSRLLDMIQRKKTDTSI